jgi:hypothetical protein
MLTQYLNRKSSDVKVPNYRIFNRLQQAHSGLPKGWFKRWRYLRSVAVIEKSMVDIPNTSN